MLQTKKSRRLKVKLLLLGPLLLTACQTLTGTSSPAPSANPCNAIELPVQDDGTRKELAQEIRNAPMFYVWPDQVVQYYKMRAAVRACKGTK